MKNQKVAAVAALVIALVMVWLAWQGFQLVRWRVRYMMPSFIAGCLVGGAVVALLKNNR